VTLAVHQSKALKANAVIGPIPGAVALWRYLETGLVPRGAVLKPSIAA